ncbi:hypothetical protein C8Q75DRAFT_736619 [Abortiporus biennis]|nr:hypothetical protein C8Q75DRAFT_736619 [Abortiporus biennis]
MSDISAEIVEGFWVAFFGTASYVAMAGISFITVDDGITTHTSLALATFDYCITFDQEVELIWRRRLNLTSVIFVVNRYLVLFFAIGSAAFQLFARTRLSCLALWFSTAVAPLLIQLCYRSFFVLRIWAIWGQHILPLVVLIPLALGIIALDEVANLGRAYKVLDCSAAFGLAFGILVLLGTLVKTLKLREIAKQAGVKTTLTSLLIRDDEGYHGTLVNLEHSLSIFISTLGPIVLYTDSKVASVELLAGPLSGFGPIIASRFILSLRVIDAVERETSQPGQYSSQLSSIRIVGNVGAPLNSSIMDDDFDDYTDSYETDTDAETRVETSGISARQLVEDPLTIGLFVDEPIVTNQSTIHIFMRRIR